MKNKPIVFQEDLPCADRRYETYVTPEVKLMLDTRSIDNLLTQIHYLHRDYAEYDILGRISSFDLGEYCRNAEFNYYLNAGTPEEKCIKAVRVIAHEPIPGDENDLVEIIQKTALEFEVVSQNVFLLIIKTDHRTKEEKERDSDERKKRQIYLQTKELKKKFIELAQFVKNNKGFTNEIEAWIDNEELFRLVEKELFAKKPS